MSEYQYYEFLAIDQPLTADETAELRALSTRATITPVSFTNEYNWGDFAGDPDKLMQRYFDAHVYVANWRTAIFMVRLPIEALTKETAKAVRVPYLLDIKAAMRGRIGKPDRSPAGACRISRGGSGSAGRRRHGQPGFAKGGNFATGNG